MGIYKILKPQTKSQKLNLRIFPGLKIKILTNLVRIELLMGVKFRYFIPVPNFGNLGILRIPIYLDGLYKNLEDCCFWHASLFFGKRLFSVWDLIFSILELILWWQSKTFSFLENVMKVHGCGPFGVSNNLCKNLIVI